MSPRLAISAALSLSVALVAHSARAQQSGTETYEERADRLFHDAEKKFDAGQIAAACASWTESLRTSPKLGTLLNLALCHETLGKPASAWREYLRGAAWAAQNGQKERQRFAHDHAIALEPQLPRVLVQLPERRAIGTVEIDGEPIPEPEWSLPQYLDPGDHTVAATAPGKLRRAIAIHVVPGLVGQTVLVPPLEDEPLPAPPPRPPPPEEPDIMRRNLGLAAVGAGAIGVGLGTYFVFHAVDLRGQMDAHCIQNTCDSTGISLHDDARSSANVATVAYGVGVVAAAVGVWLLVTPKTTHAAATVALLPTLGGATAVGTF